MAEWREWRDTYVWKYAVYQGWELSADFHGNRFECPWILYAHMFFINLRLEISVNALDMEDIFLEYEKMHLVSVFNNPIPDPLHMRLT